MSVVYRAVQSNENTDVICIGSDESQGGKNYNDIGTWCDFTFTEIPELPEDVRVFNDAHENSGLNLLKVVNDTIVVKTVEELTAELDKK